MSCWAASIGGCGGKRRTREHVISEAVLDQLGASTIGGVPWAAGPTAVSVAGAVSKVLCSQHNSDLSLLDTEAGKLMAAVRGHEATGTAWASLNGYRVERWLLKTLINLNVAGWIEHGKAPPTRQVVELAFGQRPFPSSAGLFLWTHRKPGTSRPWNIVWSVLKDETGKRIFGLLFDLGGVVFVLTTGGGNPQDLFRPMAEMVDRKMANEHFLGQPPRAAFEAIVVALAAGLGSDNERVRAAELANRWIKSTSDVGPIFPHALIEAACRAPAAGRGPSRWAGSPPGQAGTGRSGCSVLLGIVSALTALSVAVLSAVMAD